MKKIIFLLIFLVSIIGISKEVKEGTYNGAREKKLFLKSYKTDNGIRYFLVAVNGYIHGTIFDTEERDFKIKEGDIVEFTLDKHYEDFEEYSNYDCNIKVAFQENGEILVNVDNNCILSDYHTNGKYKYSEKDSNIPEKYWGKWSYKTDTGFDICAYVSKNIFAHDSDNGNYLIGIEENNGKLILDGIEIYEGRVFRRQFVFKYLSNGNINIDVYQGSVDDELYNSYRNLRKLKGKELSQCQTFEERDEE